jgi:hypothetical protein
MDGLNPDLNDGLTISQIANAFGYPTFIAVLLVSGMVDDGRFEIVNSDEENPEKLRFRPSRKGIESRKPYRNGSDIVSLN